MQNENPNYYAILPAVVRYDRSLSEMAKLLFAEITALSNKFGYCTASNQYFADLYEKNPQWVSKIIQSIAKAGHIKVEVSENRFRKIYPLTPYLPIVENLEGGRGKTRGGDSGKTLHNNTSINTKVNTKNAESATDITYSKDFLSFWESYPKKVGKGDAFKAFKKVKGVKIEVIIKSVEDHIDSKQWKEQEGRFIPNPATFLNQRRFEDELSAGITSKVKSKYAGI